MTFPKDASNRTVQARVLPGMLEQYLPHRYPMLLIDEIVDHQPGEWAIGTHMVSINEPYFRGHYPGDPIMPGTVMLEAMSQVATFILLAEEKRRHILFGGAEHLRFLRPVRPGDCITFYCAKEDDRMGIFKISGYGEKRGEKCISAVMTFTVPQQLE